jgi:hypothetical protein
VPGPTPQHEPEEDDERRHVVVFADDIDDILGFFDVFDSATPLTH